MSEEVGTIEAIEMGRLVSYEDANLSNEQRAEIAQGKLGVAFLTPQALQVLTARTPKKLISKREGPGGKMFDYVPHGWYRAKLNEAFGFDWDWMQLKVVINEESSQVLFYGTLEVRVRRPDGTLITTIRKSGEGGAPIMRKKADGTMVDLANDVKIASSDAFKRACLNLGLGLDLYWKDPEQIETKATTVIAEGKRIEELTGSKVAVLCSICNTEITSTSKATAERIISVSMENFGKPMCGLHLTAELKKKADAT